MAMKEKTKTSVDLALELYPVLRQQFADDGMNDIEQIETLYLLMLMLMMTGPYQAGRVIRSLGGRQ
ncbi:TPA: hypothetical protein ACYYHP_003344 [Salmonella enterica subsp. enterica serovar Yopougon]